MPIFTANWCAPALEEGVLKSIKFGQTLLFNFQMLQCRLTEISFEMPTLEEGLNEILNGKAYSAAENDLAGKLSEVNKTFLMI